MKKLLLLIPLIAMVVAGCEKNPPKTFDPNATIEINIQKEGTRLDTNTPEDKTDWTNEDRFSSKEWFEYARTHRLTPNQIVGLCANVILYPRNNDFKRSMAGFADRQRDYKNNKLLMYNTDVYDEVNGELSTDFLDVKGDILFVTGSDYGEAVIAYIPEADAKEALEKIKKAHRAGDYKRVYELFHTVYTAIPISQVEYDAMKAKEARL